ncbi:MAG: hypothetical protein AB7T22_12420 [Calditrichaceae bacterium]
MKAIIIWLIILVSLPAMAVDNSNVRKLNLNTDGIETFKIYCGAGFLKIQGDENLDEIQVNADIVGKNGNEKEIRQYLDEYLKLELTREGSQAILRSEINSDGHSFFSTILDKYPDIEVNLTVKVPAALKLYVDDGSGYIEINNMNSYVEIDDGSGDLVVRGVGGDLLIDDGSGDLEIDDVSGNVDIDDGSGHVKIKNVRGNVTLDDGSGNVNISQIGGSVRVDDGSGSITIDGVEKDVIIDDSGSGGLDITNVAGRIQRNDD